MATIRAIGDNDAEPSQTEVGAMVDARTHIVRLPDGRQLEVRDVGSREGAPLLFYPCTPSAAVSCELLEGPATSRGFRMICYSRPGYGRSTPRFDPAEALVANDAADTAAVLDSLGIRQFVALAWSGGGPRAFACAALLPDRCVAAASVASLVPPGAEGTSLEAGMRQENVAEFQAAAEGLDALAANIEQQIAPLVGATDAQLLEFFAAMLSPPDQRALQTELGDYLVRTMRHSLRQGPIGWRDDTLSALRPWGFSLADIAVPMTIYHGTEDGNLDPSQAVWLHEHVPSSRLHLLDGEGHVSLMARFGEMLDDLRDLSERRSHLFGPRSAA